MILEKRLYSSKEVGQIIKQNVHEIVEKLIHTEATDPNVKAEIMKQWAQVLLPSVELAIAEEITKRHVLGITLAVWAGPPGSGKGTNIETVNVLGRVYAEVTSQGVAEVLPEPFHTMLLNFSLAETMVSTGTKGMFNKPEGEYAELFGELGQVVSEGVIAGDFVPDDLVSVLVELMILYRLTQNYHKIQVDLWPRTQSQLVEFLKLLEVVTANQGEIKTELVTIKVLKPESLLLVTSNPAEFALKSKEIAQSIEQEIRSDWYKQALVTSQSIVDAQARFDAESTALEKLFVVLKQKHVSEIELIVLEELQTVCERMAFRFKTVLGAGVAPRPDEFPLSVMRRMAVFTGKTSPVFLELLAANRADLPIHVVSSAGTPEEVIAEILEALAGEKSDEKRWVLMKEIAGKIAVDVVNRKPLIVEELQQRVGSILKS